MKQFSYHNIQGRKKIKSSETPKTNPINKINHYDGNLTAEEIDMNYRFKYAGAKGSFRKDLMRKYRIIEIAKKLSKLNKK